MSTNELVEQLLNNAYREAITSLDSEAKSDIEHDLDEQQLSWLESILTSAEVNKGVLAVLITSLAKKKVTPAQDVRYHQSKMTGGYSGRVLDTNIVTPFLKAKGFPAMSESGWLTRSLEQKHPYDKDYPGAIKPNSLKKSFLGILEDITQNPQKTESYLIFIFKGLEQFRRLKNLQFIEKLPEDVINHLPILTIIDSLERHFYSNYSNTPGAARLPVLALYAVYQCLINELARYQDKELLPLASHTSADMRSRRLGDIDVVQLKDGEYSPFEAVEVKFGIPITLSIVETAYNKIKITANQRYYILSTVDIKESDKTAINSFIERVKIEHGVEIIVNGLIPSLKYYLRLLGDNSQFINYYTDNLQTDNAIKKSHRDKWNEIIRSLTIPKNKLEEEGT